MWYWYAIALFVLITAVALYKQTAFYMRRECRKGRHIPYENDGHTACIFCDLDIK